MTVLTKPFKLPFQRPFTDPFLSGVFIPSQISGLGVWYDADDPFTISETAGLVSALADKSGNGHTLTAGANEEPGTGINTMNGRNVLLFDGVLEMMTLSGFPMATANTTFMVVNVISVSNLFESAWSFSGPGDYQLDAGSTVGEFHPQIRPASIGIGNITDPTNRLGNDILIGVKFSTVNNEAELKVNGSVVGSDTNYTNNLFGSPAFRVANNRGNNQMLNMDFAEFIHYNKELSSAEVATVENYLITKWGI